MGIGVPLRLVVLGLIFWLFLAIGSLVTTWPSVWVPFTLGVAGAALIVMGLAFKLWHVGEQ